MQEFIVKAFSWKCNDCGAPLWGLKRQYTPDDYATCEERAMHHQNDMGHNVTIFKVMQMELSVSPMGSHV